MSIIPPITGIINPQHFGKAVEGVGKVFSRQHVHQSNEITIDNPAHYAEILYEYGNPIAHVKVNWEAWEADVQAGVVKNKRKERNGLPQTYTARMGDNFVSSGIVWLDYDKGLPTFEGNPSEMWNGLLNWLLSKPLFRDHAAVIVPSSGFGKNGVPKFHAGFWLDVPAFSLRDFTAYWNALEGQALEQTGVVSDHAMQQPIQPVFGTRFTAIDDRWRTRIAPYTRDVLTPTAWLRTLPVPEVVERIKFPHVARERRQADDKAVAVSRKGTQATQRETEAMLKFWLDAEVTAAQRSDMGTFIGVVWAAQSVLGADTVYEIVGNHQYAEVSSKAEALDYLLDDSEHEYTLGTLYFHAAEHGYGTQSPMDVCAADATRVIHSQYVNQSVTGNFPRVALIKSYTGSGKTTLLKSLLDTTRKQVLIVAPLKNLVEDIASELQSVGIKALSYLTDGNSDIRPTDEMRKARVLVVTPQSAAKLLDKTHPISKYGLVWIEEIDQIIRAAIHPSNVRGALYQQRHTDGFLNLVSQALRSGVSVYGVDAGLTQVTVEWFKSIITDVEIIVNTFQPHKAPLTVYPTAESVLREGIKAAVRGERVHFVTDTKDGDTGTKAIARMLARHKITGTVKVVDHDQTGNAEFVRDVNAALQNVQVLVSSPTLKSGVNITGWIPDVVALVYTHLTPRDALQAANRTRQQGQLLTYFGMPRRLDPIMTKSEAKARTEARRAAMLNVVQGIQVERTENARLVDYLAGLQDMDEQAQLQMPQKFAIGLFAGEGRNVVFADVVGELSDSDNQIRKNDPQREDVRQNWPTVRPVNRDNPADETMTTTEIARGKVHSMINGVTLAGYDLSVDSPETVYDVTHNGINAPILERAVGLRKPNDLMREQLHNPKFALETIELDTAQAQIFGTLAEFVIEGELRAETLVENGERFVRMVERVRGAYNLCVDSRQRWELVYDPDDILTTARQLATNILAVAGLKLRRGDKRNIRNPQTDVRLSDWTVDNGEYARKLLYWRATGRNNQLPEHERKAVPLIALVFQRYTGQVEAEAHADALRAFQSMKPDQQADVVWEVEKNGATVTEAVWLVSQTVAW